MFLCKHRRGMQETGLKGQASTSQCRRLAECFCTFLLGKKKYTSTFKEGTTVMKIARMMVSQQWSHNTKNAAIVNMHAWVSCWGMSKCLQPVQSLLCSAENILFILGECSRHFVGPFTGLHPEVCALNFGGGLSLHLENKHKSGVCCQLSPRLQSKRCWEVEL